MSVFYIIVSVACGYLHLKNGRIPQMIFSPPTGAKREIRFTKFSIQGRAVSPQSGLATPMSAVLPISCLRPPRTTRMSLRQAEKTRARYGLKQGQSRIFHQLPSGLRMEAIVQKRRSGKEEKAAPLPSPPPPPPPPLVFVHGSFHAAWCWAEHWMPFFSEYGHDCYAVSLLGQVKQRRKRSPNSAISPFNWAHAICL